MSQNPKIVQCVCPEHHFLMGLLTPDTLPDEEAIGIMRWKLQQMLGRVINSWCGVCKAGWQTWIIEVVVREEDRGKAIAALEEYERAMIATSSGQPMTFLAQAPGRAGRN